MRTHRALFGRAFVTVALGCMVTAGALAAEEPTDAAARPNAGPDAVQAEDPAPGNLPAPETSGTTNVEPSAQSDQTQLIQREALVMIGKDAVLKQNEVADAVVAVGGSVKVLGKAQDSAVAVAGDVEVQGEVGDAVVAVLGNVKIGPKARVGEVVAVGGKVEIAEGAVVEGGTQEVDFGMLGLATPEWLKDWFKECVLKLRPLSLGVPFVWAVFGAFLFLYAIVAVLFPRPVRACVDDLMARPATTFLVGLLLTVLVPLILMILVATGIGLFVVPFLIAAIAFGGIIGKVAIMEGLGLAITRSFGASFSEKPLVALLVGALVIAVLYLIPLLGLIAFSVMVLWALGCATTAAIGGLRREMPVRTVPAAPGLAPLSQTSPDPLSGSAFDVPLSGGAGTEPGSASATATMAVPPLIAVEEALAYPKASFWERMGAAFLDLVLVGILGNLVGGTPQGFLVALAYFAGLWTWKGTTIGGIVLGLKVVRTNGEPLTFVAALVRGLAAGFSVIVLFLGFLWIAWDKEKQGWHDKIAGTYVLKLPRGTPLVCL